jgi:integrase
MALHTLKARQVLAATAGDLSDGGGLILRIGAGRASWCLRYSAPSGKRREMGLGLVARDSLALAGESLATAREKAKKARALLDNGIDPLAAREADKQAEREADAARKAEADCDHWTLARCARDYHERVIERTRTDKHSAQWISSLEHHVPPALWHARIEALTPRMLLEAFVNAQPHDRARRPGDLSETLRRVRQRLDAVFEDAAFFGRCASNPAAAIKRKLHESRPQSKKGSFRALPYQQAPEFMRRLRAMPGTAARCLEFVLLTAARTDEAIGATWAEFDLTREQWLVPGDRMKAGEDHLVPLAPRAAAIVREQLALSCGASVLFPSPMQPDKGLSNMALLAVLDRMGLRDATTVHGLRSTFSTWANETAAARPDVIEACLAHREADRVRAAYNRASFAQDRRALLLAWAVYLDAPSAQVLTLKAA